MIPYYLLPAEEKRKVVEEVLVNTERIVEYREGGLPPFMQYAVLALQGLIYCFSMYRLILSTSIAPDSRLARVGRRWLLNFTSFLLLIVLAVSVSFFVPMPGRISRVDWWIISVMVAIVLTTTYLFLRPDILYGVPQVRTGFPERRQAEEDRVEGQFPLLPREVALGTISSSLPGMDGKAQAKESPPVPDGSAVRKGVREGDFEYLRVYIPTIEGHFQLKRPYLNKGYTISDLSDETGIPVHHLSALFNKVYGIRFNDFVNSYRLQYLEAHLNTPTFRNFTQEGLAWEAGFSSRISFFNALKKLRGITPSRFMESQQKPQEPANL
jgi:AraC-like DNA-binding protein